MTEIRFYHLQYDTTTKAVPEILGKAVERGMKALLKLPSPERCKFYDDLLWRSQPDGFLAHGLDSDPAPEIQPILISTENSVLNQPDMALVAEEAEMPDVSAFKLVCLVFDSENEPRLQRARQLWAQYKQQTDLTLTYWKQQDNGRWEKQDI